MCNYQKAILILEGNVTSDWEKKNPKGVRCNFFLENLKFVRDNRRLGDF